MPQTTIWVAKRKPRKVIGYELLSDVDFYFEVDVQPPSPMAEEGRPEVPAVADSVVPAAHTGTLPVSAQGLPVHQPVPLLAAL